MPMTQMQIAPFYSVGKRVEIASQEDTADFD
jgi:hypothetical protein